MLRSPPTETAHAVLLGTDIYERFPLLMEGSLLTSVPTFLGLCEIKIKWVLQFHAFFSLYVCGEPLCSDL